MALDPTPCQTSRSLLRSRMRVLLAAGLAALAALPVVAWHLWPPDWQAAAPATCMPDACFCEGIRAGGVRQPANAWSSLSFVVVAIGVVLTTERRRFVELFVIAAFLLGATSAYYHASLTFFGQWLD